MSLDTQTTIALITLLVSCPPTLWVLYSVYNHRRGGNNISKHCSYMSELFKLIHN
jgi:hypothetical protein